MSATQIRFNDKHGKFEGLVNGKVVSRASTSEAVAKTLAVKYGMKATVEVSSHGVMEEVRSEFSVNERFQFIDDFVGLVVKGSATSLVVSGPGGLGKTHTIMQSMKARGKKELTVGEFEGDYLVVKGFSTAKYMYRTLFENNGKTIIFDDCDSVFKDVIAANILKGALDSGEERIITWGAEFAESEDLPNRFAFYGRVIFISNMAISKLPQAIVSRALRVDLAMTTDEKVERIETVMQEESFLPGMSRADKKEVAKFIRDNAKKFTDLNVRTAVNIAKVRRDMDEDRWERAALYMAMS